MRRILLVEDEAILRETYEVILATQPYLFDTAENGLVALEKCKENKYDLILLDLMMPVMDGVGFLEQYTALQPLSNTKVLILSNLSSGKKLDMAIELGGVQVALKSDMTPKQLLSLIRYELMLT